MSWVKIDDGFHDHRKTLHVSLAALGLYMLGQSYSSRHATDGHLSAMIVQGLCRGIRKRQPHWQKLADELVEAGLWERDGTHYRVHDFLHYNPSAAERRTRAAEIRVVRAAAGRASGRARTQNTVAKSSDVGSMSSTVVLMSDACNRQENSGAQVGENATPPEQTANKQTAPSELPYRSNTPKKDSSKYIITSATNGPTALGRRLKSGMTDEWDAAVAAVWEELKGAPPSRMSLNDLDALRGRVPLPTVQRNLRHYLTTVQPRFHSLRRFAETIGDHDPTRQATTEPGIVTYTPFALQAGRETP